MQYTESQQKFINSESKFIKLLAPAGCGKTACLIAKAEHILQENPQAKIYIFTFTNSAVNEIQNRCNNANLSVFTLNSWGNNYVKKSVLKNAKLLKDTNDKKFLFTNTLQSIWKKQKYQGIFDKIFTSKNKLHYSLNMLEFIDSFKNIGFKHYNFTNDIQHNTEIYNKHFNFINNISLHRYYYSICTSLLQTLNYNLKTNETLKDFLIKHWFPFWKDCCQLMLDSGLYTFDDQKYFANIELEKQINNNEKWKGISKVDYIFIDEFQDVSPLDAYLIANLQKLNNSSLIIIGDDDQAIYEFRGATPYFILKPNIIFNNEFETITLDTNFRFPSNILEKSLKLISYNTNREPKKVTSQTNMQPAKINIIEFNTQQEMIEQIIDNIKNTPRNKTIAVLSRLKSDLLPYQILLTKEKIPFSTSDDLAFFLTSAAKNLNNVLKIKLNYNHLVPEDVSNLFNLYCIYELPQQKKYLLERNLYQYQTLNTENISQTLMLLKNNPLLSNILKDKSFISNFTWAIEKLQKSNSVFDTLKYLLENFNGLKKNYSKSLEDLYFRDPPLASLLDFAKTYKNDFNSFVTDFNKAITKAEQETYNNDEKRIVISTALRVKGQQYDKVIIINASDGIFPKQQAKQSLTKDELESERRLFYVATTRPKEELLFYRSKTKTILNGEKETQISPFILEGEYNHNTKE